MDLIKQIKLMESLDMQVQEDAKFALSNRIAEGTGIGVLVQYYAKSQSVRALELLCLVREPHDKVGPLDCTYSEFRRSFWTR